MSYETMAFSNSQKPSVKFKSGWLISAIIIR